MRAGLDWAAGDGRLIVASAGAPLAGLPPQRLIAVVRDGVEAADGDWDTRHAGAPMQDRHLVLISPVRSDH